jgi:xanthine dehydrogenase YagS FAD-binding subunit
MNPFAWTSPSSVVEATTTASTIVSDAMKITPDAASRTPGSIIKAGGIDLIDLMKENLLAPQTIVNLRFVSGLDEIAEEQGGLRIGAMVTLSELAGHPIVRQRYPILAETAESAASPQIRNIATLGGNLLQRPRCWYFRSAAFPCLRKGGQHCFALLGDNRYHAIFDNLPCAIVHPSSAAIPLVALGADIELNAKGNLRRLPLEDFFVPVERDIHRENDLRSHEILTAVILPVPQGPHMARQKQGEKAFDWPLADVSVVLDLDDRGYCRKASIVLGAAAPTPYRARSAEALLIGQRIDETVARNAARSALDGAHPLTMNRYKLPLFETLIRRALLQAASQA